MKKKTLLIFSVALISLLVLLPSAGSVLANGYEYYYAYRKYPSAEAGVWGYNYVYDNYDNDVYTGHGAEYVVVSGPCVLRIPRWCGYD